MAVILAVLIPVFNEERLIQGAVERLLASPAPVGADGRALDRLLVVVDDGSTDLTGSALAGLAGRGGVTVLRHEQNMGKGAALRTGLKAALEAGAELFVVHDADMEYDPADHAKLLGPILDGRADAAIGSRFLGSTHRVLYYWHAVANRFITMFSNMMTNLNLSDIECCLKGFNRAVAERLTIQERRFGVEPELVARLAAMTLPELPVGSGNQMPRNRRLRIYEVAVSYAGRTYAEGKKIRWQDGFSALRAIVKYNLMQ